MANHFSDVCAGILKYIFSWLDWIRMLVALSPLKIYFSPVISNQSKKTIPTTWLFRVKNLRSFSDFYSKPTHCKQPLWPLNPLSKWLERIFCFPLSLHPPIPNHHYQSLENYSNSFICSIYFYFNSSSNTFFKKQPQWHFKCVSETM